MLVNFFLLKIQKEAYLAEEERN